MADKDIQMKHHNGTDWDSLFPNTKSENVERTDGTTVEKGLTDVETGLENKVDKVDGKGLSTNDFTDEYKDKVDNFKGVAVSDTEPVPENAPVWFELL